MKWHGTDLAGREYSCRIEPDLYVRPTQKQGRLERVVRRAVAFLARMCRC